MTKMEVKRAMLLAGICALGGVACLYVGYVKTYLDHEEQTTFFFKKSPTFQIEFYDPFANEGDDAPIDKLSPRARSEFAKYCKNRFGWSDDTTPALSACKAQIPNYM
ncbi:hypothetical protein PMO31116_00146 [Pandoraea morbifera]|uniref:Lipoprotein n=1 Tax=Pandoraea morbifera TaxID=2508300 RepID=A0A5E4RGH3_9BURK|nr:hypothetical protein [Pandoraea morbifera]VVD61901.1 hypothetical protein PMO31116_00146 [Pandoraea morbifera]